MKALILILLGLLIGYWVLDLIISILGLTNFVILCVILYLLN